MLKVKHMLLDFNFSRFIYTSIKPKNIYIYYRKGSNLKYAIVQFLE